MKPSETNSPADEASSDRATIDGKNKLAGQSGRQGSDRFYTL
jgi:hypothetical protein